MIAPIETRYGGRLYRSRTEARWAVALTVAEIAFEYEHEGFDLPCGRYLPDFWLPETKMWLEVKGVEPTKQENLKCDYLARETGFPVMLVIGAPREEYPYPEYYTGDTIGTRREGFCDYQTTFELPHLAYIAAISERFDGKPRQEAARSTRPRSGAPYSSRFW